MTSPRLCWIVASWLCETPDWKHIKPISLFDISLLYIGILQRYPGLRISQLSSQIDQYLKSVHRNLPSPSCIVYFLYFACPPWRLSSLFFFFGQNPNQPSFQKRTEIVRISSQQTGTKAKNKSKKEYKNTLNQPDISPPSQVRGSGLSGCPVRVSHFRANERLFSNPTTTPWPFFRLLSFCLLSVLLIYHGDC